MPVEIDFYHFFAHHKSIRTAEKLSERSRSFYHPNSKKAKNEKMHFSCIVVHQSVFKDFFNGIYFVDLSCKTTKISCHESFLS